MIFHAMLLLLDSKDVAVVFCVGIALVRTGAGALAVAAQTFTQ